jgi:hypothetical protein
MQTEGGGASGTGSSAATGGASDRVAELRALMQRVYEAFERGDGAYLEGLVARDADALMVGTDPREWWAGRETIVRVFRAQLAEVGGRVRVEPGEQEAPAAGPVGWIAARAVFRLPAGAALPLRITAVFRRERGAWRIVQWHASVGVPNAEAIGQALTV